MNLRPSGYEPDVQRSSAPAGIPVSASPGQQRQPPHDTRSDSFPDQETKVEPEEGSVWFTHLECAEQYRLHHPDRDGRKPAQPGLGSGFRPHGVFLTGADVAFHWTSDARQALLGLDNAVARLLPWGARPDRPTGGACGGGSAAIPRRRHRRGYHAQVHRQPARDPVRRRPARGRAVLPLPRSLTRWSGPLPWPSGVDWRPEVSSLSLLEAGSH